MNPLLCEFNTPYNTAPFTEISTEHFLPAIKTGIAESKKVLEQLKVNPEAPTFINTIVAMERNGELLDRASKIFFNLNSCETNAEIQKLARQIAPLLTAFSNDILLDKDLFTRVKHVHETKESFNLSPEERTLLDKTYKNFVRNGANLDEDAKNKLREIDEELSKLTLAFGEHVLAETNAYIMEIKDEAELEGLPDAVIKAAAIKATEKGKDGSWVFTLDYPSYLPFTTYAKNRERREELYRAFSARAFRNNENDNQNIIKQITRLKHQRANLLGYTTHAHFVLEERMAGNPSKVHHFIDDLLSHALPVAHADVADISLFAKKTDGLEIIQRWDFAYYSEKLKKERFSIDDETLRPYFKLEAVVNGVFEIARRLYGLVYIENNDIPVYHPDVKAYEVQDESGKHIGVYYADYFPRSGKRSGAWMTSYKGQKKINGIDHRPHVSIVCNFTKPTDTTPSLLTFDEVKTLFHEFGHSLHCILSDCTYAGIGTTNVYWDFVELPSQIMENWAYEKECLDIFANHYETGESIPMELIDRIKESAVFLEGYNTVRQISFARLDMAWHGADPSNIDSVGNFEKEVLKSTNLFPKVNDINMSCSFSHIFAGGYSAGYYSYKWAEVLDADAFEYFKENGIFNKKIANKFKKHVLSAGGSEHPMTLYKRFRGKEASPKALLRRAGLVEMN